MAPNNHRMMMINNDRSRTFNSDRQHWTIIKLFMAIIIIISMSTKTVDASGYFELQFIEGIRNSTTIHVCLKEFWNSQINLNRCTFGQKTIIYYEQQQSQQHSKQSMIRIPFSFRWIVSIRIFFCLPNSVHKLCYMKIDCQDNWFPNNKMKEWWWWWRIRKRIHTEFTKPLKFFSSSSSKNEEFLFLQIN